MAENSAIEWTDHTFNPWVGCTKVGPGCDHCYAEGWAKRAGKAAGVEWGGDRRRTSAATWQQPVKWNRLSEQWVRNGGQRTRVFCASLADVFDNDVPPVWRADLFELIHKTPHLDWLLLTKRIGNAWKMMADAIGVSQVSLKLPLPNVWIGATVVNQAEADRDIPKLLAVPARVRFLSIEPMLGPIDLERPRPGPDLDQGGGNMICQPWLIQSGIDWVICGGESGAGARPMHPDWARSLRDQCASAGVPFLFKQWGEWVPADDNSQGVIPVTEIVGDVDWQEGKRVRVQWLSPNDSIVGHSFARLGKKAAGRVLDGRTHDGSPSLTRDAMA